MIIANEVNTTLAVQVLASVGRRMLWHGTQAAGLPPYDSGQKNATPANIDRMPSCADQEFTPDPALDLLYDITGVRDTGMMMY